MLSALSCRASSKQEALKNYLPNWILFNYQKNGHVKNFK